MRPAFIALRGMLLSSPLLQLRLSVSSSAANYSSSIAASRAAPLFRGRHLLRLPAVPGPCTSLGRRTHMSGHNGHVQLVTSDFLAAEDLHPSTQLHLIILNYVLPPQTAHLWQRATTRICADGGANRLFDQLPAMLPGVDPLAARSSHLPDLIKGDLDSVRPDVTDFYTAHGVPFIDLSSDQETTDLEKCLLFLEGRLRSLSEQTAVLQHSAAVPSAATATHGSRGRAGTAHAPAAAAAARTTSGSGQFIISSSSNGAGGGRSGLTAGQLQLDCSAASSSSIGPATPGGAADAAAASGGPTGNAADCSSPAAERAGLMQQQQHQQQQQQQGPPEQQQQQQQQQQQHSPPILGEVLLLMEDSQPQQQLHTAQGSGAAGWLSRLASGGSSTSPNGGGSSSAREVQASILGSMDAEQASKRVHQDHLILVLGALGGRLDHTLSNLNTLYCYPHLHIALWGDGNLVRLLRAGRSLIRPSRVEGPTCGLVPLARPATASSRGLKWDLDKTHMCFRGLLSTSNVISSDTIEVTTDEDLLWITAVGNTLAAR